MKTLWILAIVTSFLFHGSVLETFAQNKADQLVTIDVLKTLKKSGSLKLSDIVSDVEVVKLDPTPKAFYRNTEDLTITKNYIFLYCFMENKAILFNRDGSFNNLIGSVGKGPGEYQRLEGGSLSPDERHIILVDGRPGRKLFLFNVDGSLICSKKIPDDVPFLTLQGVHFVDNERFLVALSRPGPGGKGIFARVVMFNLSLEVEKRFLTIADPADLSMYLLQYVWFGKSKEGFYYCEGLRDTVYYFSGDDVPRPKYYFHISKNKETEDGLRGSMHVNRLTGKNFLWGVYDLPNHLLAYGTSEVNETFLICYDKLNNSAFSCNYQDPCKKDRVWKGETLKKGPYPYVENDLFGLEPIYIRAYQPKEGFIVMDFNPSSKKDELDIKCFRNLPVKNSALRDKVADIIENSTSEENKVLLIMHLKK